MDSQLRDGDMIFIQSEVPASLHRSMRAEQARRALASGGNPPTMSALVREALEEMYGGDQKASERQQGGD